MNTGLICYQSTIPKHYLIKWYCRYYFIDQRYGVIGYCVAVGCIYYKFLNVFCELKAQH